MLQLNETPVAEEMIVEPEIHIQDTDPNAEQEITAEQQNAVPITEPLTIIEEQTENPSPPVEVSSAFSMEHTTFGQNMFLNISKPLNTPRKLKTLALSDKIRLLKEVEKGDRKKKDIAKEFGIPTSTLSTIYKSRDKLYEFAEVTTDSNRKRMKKAKHPDVEEETLKWLLSMQSLHIPITGTIIREKAQWFGEILGHKDFQASAGWLEKFRSRYLYNAKSIQKKAAKVTCESDFHKWINDIFPRMIKDYDEHNIFCANETCLFYKCLLNKDRAGKCDYFSEEQIKEWVTLLIATNMSGLEKLPLLLIGKTMNPACLLHIKSFPVQYKYSKNACMTTDLFQDWLKALDERFSKENRKIAMIINDNPSHASVGDLQSIKLFFVPQNLTSLIQPANHGIVTNIKFFYRKSMVLKFLNSLKETEVAKTSLLDCMRDVYIAWQSVLPPVITNSFKKAGLFKNNSVESTACLFLQNNDRIQEEWKRLQEMSYIPKAMTFESYVNIDEHFMLLTHISDNEIINELLYNDTDSEVKCQDSKPLIIPSFTETFCVTKNLQSFIESRQNVPSSVFQAMAHIEQFLLNEKCNDECTLDQ